MGLKHVLRRLLRLPMFTALTQVGTALRSEGRPLTQSRERHRARSTLVVVQVALALVLLIGSGLIIRTFQALKHVQPGFDRPDTVQTLRISIPSTLVRDPVAAIRMEQSILNRIAAISGVRSAGLTTVVPLDNDRWQDPVFAEDHTYTVCHEHTKDETTLNAKRAKVAKKCSVDEWGSWQRTISACTAPR